MHHLVIKSYYITSDNQHQHLQEKTRLELPFANNQFSLRQVYLSLKEYFLQLEHGLWITSK